MKSAMKNLTLLLRVIPVASVAFKVRCQNTIPLTPNLQKVLLYSHIGVDNLSCLIGCDV